jgi:hypothetical protein
VTAPGGARSAPAGAGGLPDWFPTFTLLLGVLLLADSLAQLGVAIGRLDAGTIEQRVTALRLIFTQTTPWMVALLLMGLGAWLRSRHAARWAAWLLWAAAVVVLFLVWRYVTDSAAFLLDLDRPSAEQARRATYQGGVSGAVLAAALVGAGVLLRRVSGSGSPT